MGEHAGSGSDSTVAAMAEPGVLGVDHVGIAVPDLDAAVEWYASTLGLVVTHEEVNEEQGVREAMLSAPGGIGGAAVQLLAPLRPDSAIGKFLDRNGPGIQQVAYRVADVEAVSAALRAQGLRLLYEQPRRGTAGSRINLVHPKDAGGVLVELVAPAPAHCPGPGRTARGPGQWPSSPGTIQRWDRATSDGYHTAQ